MDRLILRMSLWYASQLLVSWAARGLRGSVVRVLIVCSWTT